jgi:hypothetical protein
MKPHVAEILAETWLEEPALGMRQRTSAAGWVFETVPDRLDSWSRFTMQLLFALGTHALDTRWHSIGRSLYSYNLLRNLVRLLLKAVAWLIDGQLGLHHTRTKQPLRGLISHVGAVCASG